MNPSRALVFIACAAQYFFAYPARASQPVPELKCHPRPAETGKIYDFPMVLSGDLPIVGNDVRNLVGLSLIGGKWRRIALQVDEKNAADEYVLENGMPFTKATDDFYFDANDEMAFYGRELGRNFSQKDLGLPGAKYWLDQSRAHWQIHVCTNGIYRGSTLIVSLRSKADLPANLAVQLDVTDLKVESKNYRYHFAKEQVALLGRIFLKQGPEEIEAIARSSFLMIARLPWFLPDAYLDKSSFKSEIESWQVGSVRAIVAVGVKFKNFLKMFNFHMFSELVFYDDLFQIPTEIHFPIEAQKFLKPGSGLVYTLGFWNAKDWDIETNMKRIPQQDPQWVVDHAHDLAPQENYFATGKFSGDKWRFLTKIRIDEKAIKDFPPPLLIQGADFTDEKLVGHWPWLKKVQGDMGVFLDLSKVKKGVYDFGLDLVLRTEAYQSFADYGLAKAYWQSHL